MIEEVARHHSVQPNSPEAFQIETTASFGQDAFWWASQAPDLLVLSLPSEPLLQNYFFAKLRKVVPKSQSMILISAAITQDLIQISSEFARVRMLKSP